MKCAGKVGKGLSRLIVHEPFVEQLEQPELQISSFKRTKADIYFAESCGEDEKGHKANKGMAHMA
jgi:hypothetical protein